jgi:hypothetical protein
MPDWQAVAQDYAGVHLSWARFLTTEGYISGLDHATTPPRPGSHRLELRSPRR